MAALVPQVIDLAFNNLPHDEKYHKYTERFHDQDAERYAQSVLGIVDADKKFKDCHGAPSETARHKVDTDTGEKYLVAPHSVTERP